MTVHACYAKQKRLCFILLIGIFFLIVSYMVGNGTNEPYQKRHYVCFKFISEGTLYGGQPYCADGPVIFYLGYPFYIWGGEEFLQIAFFILRIMINTHIVFLLYSILRKEVKTDPLKTIIVLLFFYVGWIYFIIDNAPETLLATYFLLCGVYLLFYSTYHFRNGIAQILFMLAFFSKITSLLVIVSITLFFLFYVRKQKNFFRTLKECAVGWIIFSSTVILMVLISPHLLDYMFFTHTSGNEIGRAGIIEETVSIIKSLPNIHPRYIFVLWFFIFQILCIHCFFLEKRSPKKFYYFAGSFLWVLQMIITAYKFGEGHLDLLQMFYRYNAVFFPYSILSLFLIKEKYSQQTTVIGKSLLQIFFWGSILFPFIQTIGHITILDATTDRDVVREIKTLDLQLKKVYQMIPINSKTIILIDTPYTGYGRKLLDIQNGSIQIDELILDEDFSVVDGYLKQYMQKKFGTGFNVIDTSSLSPTFHSKINRLLDGNYSVYIPQREYIPFFISEFTKQSLKERYCDIDIVILDIAEAGPRFSKIYFRDPQTCYYSAKKIAEYYSSILHTMCNLSSSVHVSLTKALSKMKKRGIDVPIMSCSNPRDIIRRYHFERSYALLDGLVLSLIIIGNMVVMVTNKIKRR